MGNTKKLIQAAAGAGDDSVTEFTLYQWGKNTYGQIGMGSSTYNPSLTKYTSSNDFSDDDRGRKITGSGGSYLAIKSDGTCWAFGRNENGQLGLGDLNDRSSPVQVGTETNFTAVSTSGYQTFFIRGGSLYATGGNAFGNLGLGDTTRRSSPVQVSFSSPVRIEAGKYFSSFVINSSQNLYSTGYNYHGQLGQGDKTNRSTFAQVGSQSYWSEVAASNCVIAAGSGGRLFTWGENSYGQLGDGTSGTFAAKCSPVQIATDKSWDTIIASASYGPQYACDNSGNLWAIGGINTSGQLGIGNTTSRSSPVQVTTNVVGVAVNSSGFSAYSMLLKDNGTIWSWGVASVGGLADGTWVSRSSPVQVGSLTTWAYPSDGIIKTTASGQNDLYIWGNVGYATGAGNFSSPVQIGSVNEWKTSANGNDFSLGIKTNGTLWSWGYNGFGQLGLGDLNIRASPTQIGSATNWSKISAGTNHAAAINEDGDLYVWGSNQGGKLGVGDTTDRCAPIQVGSESYLDIACGGEHTASIRSNGTVWVWGAQQFGQFGVGDTTSRSSPVQTTSYTDAVQIDVGSYHTVFRRNSQAGLMFAGLSQSSQSGTYRSSNVTTMTEVLTSYTFSHVSSGDNHLGGIVGTSLYMWGTNSNGALGNGSSGSHATPAQVAGNWLTVSAGKNNTFAVTTDNKIYATGNNGQGYLGLGDTTNRSSFTQIGSNTTWHALPSKSHSQEALGGLTE